MDEVDHRDTYVSRWSALKNLVTSETADVQPFVLVQINFVVRRRHCELVITRCMPSGLSKARSGGHVVVHKPVRNWQESIFSSTIRFTFHFGV